MKTAMELLKSGEDKLGPPKIEGMDTVAGKEEPAIYFGSTKMNNNFPLLMTLSNKRAGQPQSS